MTTFFLRSGWDVQFLDSDLKHLCPEPLWVIGRLGITLAEPEAEQQAKPSAKQSRRAIPCTATTNPAANSTANH